MKKKLALIVCCVMIASLCCVAFAGCNDKVDADVLQLLLDDLKDSYQKGIKGSTVTNETYELPGKTVWFDPEGERDDVEVLIKWTVSDTRITVSAMDDDGYVKINIPEVDEDVNYTLTGTLVNSKGKAYKINGETASFSVDLSITTTGDTQKAENIINAAIVKNPVASTAYKWAAYQVGSQRMLYFAGLTNKSYVFKTTENFSEAKDVYIETVSGGFNLYFDNDGTKTYLVLMDSSGNASIGSATTAPETPLSIHQDTGALVGKPSGASQDYFFCVRNKFPDDIRGNTGNYLTNESYMSSERPVCLFPSTQFDLPSYNTGLTEAQILAKAAALPDGEVMWGRYSLTGTITSMEAYNSNFYNRTVTMTVGSTEVVCYQMYQGNDLNVGDTITVTGVLCKYEGKIEFRPTCRYEVVTATTVEKSQEAIAFVDNAISSPVEGTQYKLAVFKGEKTLYFNGSTQSQAYYLGSTETVADAKVCQIETVGSGFYIWFMDGTTKKYVTVVIDGKYVNANISTDVPANVFNIDADTKIPYIAISGEKYYLTSSGTYTSISGATWSKMNAESLDISEWALRIVAA